MKWIQKKPPSTVLSLSLDGGRLEAVVLQRSAGSASVLKTVSAPLSLDILHNETDLVGREIRNLLDAAGIKERNCVVAVPQSWAMIVHSKVPEMEEADVPDYLQIEAERGFPYALDELQVAGVRHKSPGGDTYSSQIGVPLGHIARLEAALTSAELKPLSFSLAITALPGALADEKHAAITLVVGDSSVRLLLAVGGAPVALRTLEGVIDTEDPEKRIQSELVARELRVTIGQLPPDVRESLRVVQIVGSAAAARQLADGLQARARALGLTIEHVTAYSGTQFGMALAAPGGVSCEVSLAAQFLGRKPMTFEFLAPKPTIFQQLAARYASRRLGSIGAVAAAVAVVVIGMFLYQEVQLNRLNGEYGPQEKNGMKAKVAELDAIQKRTVKFRPWFDDSMSTLSILKKVTESFPDSGDVSAKSITIRNAANVTCRGITRDKNVLLRTVTSLGKDKSNVSGASIETITGVSPMQFTFTFNWGSTSKKP